MRRFINKQKGLAAISVLTQQHIQTATRTESSASPKRPPPKRSETDGADDLRPHLTEHECRAQAASMGFKSALKGKKSPQTREGVHVGADEHRKEQQPLHPERKNYTPQKGSEMNVSLNTNPASTSRAAAAHQDQQPASDPVVPDASDRFKKIPDLRPWPEDKATYKVPTTVARKSLNDPDSMLNLDDVTIQQYRRDGYVVVRNVFKPSVLSMLSSSCRAGADRRGDQMPFPACDSKPNQPQVEAKLSHYVATDDSGNKVEGGRSSGGAHIGEKSTVEGGGAALRAQKLDADVPAPKEKDIKKRKIKITLRTQKDVDRAYAKLKKMQEKRSKRMGIDTSPSSKKFEEMSEQERREDGAKQLNAYKNSGQLQQDMNAKTSVDLVTAYLSGIQTNWLRLAFTDERVREALRGSVGNVLGRYAAQLSGNVGERLYSDLLLRKNVLGNALSHQCAGGALNMDSAAKSTIASVVLSPLPDTPDDVKNVPMGPNVGGYSILPGSHQFMLRRTNNGKNLSGLQHPSSWNVGEWLRSVEGLREIEPVSLTLNPGDVLFTHPLTVYGMFPNMDPRVCPWVYNLTLMPNDTRYDGVPRGWMTKDSNGPLHNYRIGDPLDDENKFPLMYHALEEIEEDVADEVVKATLSSLLGDDDDESDPDADLLLNMESKPRRSSQ